MTVLEAIALFENEMNNEIFHSCVSDEAQDSLLAAVKRVKKIVIETYEAEKKQR